VDWSAIALIGAAVVAGLGLQLLGRRSLRNSVRRYAQVSPAELHQYAMRLLAELVTLPVERDGYIKVFPAARRLNLNQRQAFEVNGYLRERAFVEGRTGNSGALDRLRLTAAGHGALEEHRRAANTDSSSPHGYQIINNFGSMVQARDIHGGAVNAGTVGGDLVAGVTGDQLIALAAALRSDAGNIIDPTLQQQAKACAADLEASAGDASPTGAKRRQVALDQATKLVGLAQGVFTLAQGVVQAIFGA
jgi:hypothetical protein